VQPLLKQRDAAAICSLSERTLERLRVSNSSSYLLLRLSGDPLRSYSTARRSR